MKPYEHLARLIDFLASAEGFVSLVVISALVTYALASANGRWFILAALIYAATLGTYQNEWYISRLASPLQEIRSYGRPIVIGLLAVLLIPSFDSQEPRIARRPHIGAVVFLAYQLLFATRLMTSGVLSKGWLSLICYTLTFAVMGVGLSRWLRSMGDVHKLLRAVVGVGILLCVATVYQSMHNTSGLYWHFRYFGTTGNAQHAAALIALILPVALYLITSPLESRGMKQLWVITTGVLVLLLLWTGSRTGALMSITGVVILGRSRVWRLMPAVLSICGAAYLVLQILLPESLMTIQRYTSTHNTRAAPFESMLHDFSSSPIVGVGGAELAESSYLGTAAKMGLAGLAVMALLYWLIARDLLQLARLRNHLDEHRALFDLILAGFAALAIGGVVEGYLLAVFNFPVFAVYFYCALLGFALDAARQKATATPEYAPRLARQAF